MPRRGARDPFASVLPFGIFAAWIMPITGIPLPFLSYGGSFLFINLVGMALVQRVAAEYRRGAG